MTRKDGRISDACILVRRFGATCAPNSKLKAHSEGCSSTKVRSRGEAAGRDARHKNQERAPLMLDAKDGPQEPGSVQQETQRGRPRTGPRGKKTNGTHEKTRSPRASRVRNVHREVGQSGHAGAGRSQGPRIEAGEERRSVAKRKRRFEPNHPPRTRADLMRCPGRTRGSLHRTGGRRNEL